jgi:hypothetical protein
MVREIRRNDGSIPEISFKASVALRYQDVKKCNFMASRSIILLQNRLDEADTQKKDLPNFRNLAGLNK